MSQQVVGPYVYPIEINEELTTAQIVVADNTTTSVTYTVPSVTLGDFVDVSVLVYDAGPPENWVELPAGALVQARVSAANQVRVSFTAVGAGTGFTVVADSKIMLKVRKRNNGSLPTFP
jgi:hypothetical protein